MSEENRYSFKLVKRYPSKGEGKHIRVRTSTQKNGDMCSIVIYEPALSILGTRPGGRATVMYANEERRLAVIKHEGDMSYNIHKYNYVSDRNTAGLITFSLPKPDLDIPVYQRSFIFNSNDTEVFEDLMNDGGKAIVVELPDPNTIRT